MEHRLVTGIEKALGWGGPGPVGTAFARGHLADSDLITRLMTPNRLLETIRHRHLATLSCAATPRETRYTPHSSCPPTSTGAGKPSARPTWRPSAGSSTAAEPWSWITPTPSTHPGSRLPCPGLVVRRAHLRQRLPGRRRHGRLQPALGRPRRDRRPALRREVLGGPRPLPPSTDVPRRRTQPRSVGGGALEGHHAGRRRHALTPRLLAHRNEDRLRRRRPLPPRDLRPDQAHRCDLGQLPVRRRARGRELPYGPGAQRRHRRRRRARRETDRPRPRVRPQAIPRGTASEHAARSAHAPHPGVRPTRIRRGRHRVRTGHHALWRHGPGGRRRQASHLPRPRRTRPPQTPVRAPGARSPAQMWRWSAPASPSPPGSSTRWTNSSTAQRSQSCGEWLPSRETRTTRSGRPWTPPRSSSPASSAARFRQASPQRSRYPESLVSRSAPPASSTSLKRSMDRDLRSTPRR